MAVKNSSVKKNTVHAQRTINDINNLPCNLGVWSLSATALQLVYPTMYEEVKEKL